MTRGTAKIEVKNFDSPDEARPFEANGEVRLVKVAGKEVGRGVFEPGWRWSSHVKRAAPSPASLPTSCTSSPGARGY